MTDLDEAFVEAVAQTALQLEHNGAHVLLRAPEQDDVAAMRPAAFDADDEPEDTVAVVLDGGRSDAVLEVVVGGEVVGAIVPVDDGYGVLVLPEDGADPSGEQETLEDALDELGV